MKWVEKSNFQPFISRTVIEVLVSMQVYKSNKSGVAKEEMKNVGLTRADSVDLCSKIMQRLQDGLHTSGTKIQLHEDNMKFLSSLIQKLDVSIINLQVLLEKYSASNTPKIETNDGSVIKNEEDEISEQIQILQLENSAAGILCHLRTNVEMPASDLTLTEDVLGIVAELGKVEDSSLSRIFSEYLGTEIMLAIVCKTYNGVKSLETHDEGGQVNKKFGLYGLGAAIGRNLEGRFHVISLETLRPYAGEFVANDPQRTLDLPKPRLPNGECPAGFLGYAVNMITIDRVHLFFLTETGYGLRETLFYTLFSRLQVYRTRMEMLQAIPCITDGAVSLDGGIIKKNGLFCLGHSLSDVREDIKVKFPKSSSTTSLHDDYVQSERQMKEMKWEKEKMLGDIKRERALLDYAKLDFERKKAEFVKLIAETTTQWQHQTPPASRRST